MMKKVILLFALIILFTAQSFEKAHAGIISEWKANKSIEKELRLTQKAIENLFELQTLYTNTQKHDKLKHFYSEKYRNSDAFDKNTTFSIIKENYELYPNLVVTLDINNINISGNYATVDVFEYAEAKDIKRDDVDLTGKLEAFAHTIYYLEKTDDNWLIIAEHALEENNSVVFGEAQYLDLKLTAPMIIGAGDEYTSKLEINNLPRKALVMGSITQTPATFPLEDEEQENFRVIEDLSLERIFVANNQNTNEYNIASIGITRGQPIPNGNVKLYLSGLAFVMTRVNVIPENTLYKKAEPLIESDDDDDDKDVEDENNA